MYRLQVTASIIIKTTKLAFILHRNKDIIHIVCLDINLYRPRNIWQMRTESERQGAQEANGEEESRNKSPGEMIIKKKSWTKTKTEASTAVIIPIDSGEGRRSMCD